MKMNRHFMFLLAAAFASTIAFSANNDCANKTKCTKCQCKDKVCTTKKDCAEIWTENIDQAFECAKKTNKKVFINFTGSDWCYWCILAEKNIFSKKEWKDFSKDLICLKVDFPQKNQADVMTMAKREELAREFNVMGYPTFYLADGNKKILSRFSAGRKDCKTFINEVKAALK